MSQTSLTSPSRDQPSASGSLRGADDPLASLQALADGLEGQPEQLLELLRRIEQLHRTIQDGPFRSSLPADRNALFQLLSEMESSGGWPYIPACSCAPSWICSTMKSWWRRPRAKRQPKPQTAIPSRASNRWWPELCLASP